MKKLYLGINGVEQTFHDASAAIVGDGKVIAAVEEERFNRIKHTNGLPINAVKYCLEEAGVSIDKIEHVGFYLQPQEMYTKFFLEPVVEFFPKTYLAFKGGFKFYREFLKIESVIRKTLGISKKAKIHLINHHFAHAASAFYLSPFEEAAVLTIDGSGDEESIAYFIGKGNQLKKVKSVLAYPKSLGYFYASIADYIGLGWIEGSGKMMGLAPYGKSTFYDLFKDIIQLHSNGDIDIDLSYFSYHLGGHNKLSKKLCRHLGPKRDRYSLLTQHHADIAASAQKILEEATLHLAKQLKKETGLDNLCYAGGIALNIDANENVRRRSGFKNIFIPPAAYDGGTSLGCALYLYHNVNNNQRIEPMRHAYLGPSYTNEQIKSELKLSNVKFELCENIAKVGANLLSEDKIIGWFQGRMEWGPRALGNRSILANPTNPNMKDLVNKKVKHREHFRPFAPAVLEEDAHIYFDLDIKSPSMLFKSEVRPGWRIKLPAITHVDGSARVQTVGADVNYKFAKLLEYFKEITGVSVVLNTSFNVRGEPIVNTPKEALNVLKNTGLDTLLIGDYVVYKHWYENEK